MAMAFLWPGGKNKALAMSYDDGCRQDKQLVEVLNRYGIKGTFHLNSGVMENTSYRLSKEERDVTSERRTDVAMIVEVKADISCSYGHTVASQSGNTVHIGIDVNRKKR